MTCPLAEKSSCFGLRCIVTVTGPPAHSKSSTISRSVEHWGRAREGIKPAERTTSKPVLKFGSHEFNAQSALAETRPRL